MERVFIARNELEKKADELQRTLQLSEMDMTVVLEMVLSTARHKVIARNAYDTFTKAQKGDTENGN